MARLAGLHAMHGHVREARHFAHRALQINAHNADALYAIEMTLSDYHERLDNADAILRIAPHHYMALRHKALALRAIGRPEEAMAIIRQHLARLRDTPTTADELRAAEVLLIKLGNFPPGADTGP